MWKGQFLFLAKFTRPNNQYQQGPLRYPYPSKTVILDQSLTDMPKQHQVFWSGIVFGVKFDSPSLSRKKLTSEDQMLNIIFF